MEEKNTPVAVAAPVKKIRKQKVVQRLLKGKGQAHIKSSYNNTIISITDQNGSLIAWSSAGKCGFKSAKKATPYAAGIVVKDALEKSKDSGIKEVDVFIKGIGPAREGAIRALAANGLQIASIKDVTPVPHNGCRPKKPRRV
ncbi:30S ribosomal protein S11 [Candidatus Kuenenbacteria bacterium RIFCSPLOWO2_12_FULL_42_13]|uniref:Small ribosomal subunit protein uS11 n=4 Tax=Candidatus Kueneniibacteriota TaxID=1752740 RepID=A0A0G0YW03_9BACT|nr:MAG: 30S ribosomal protein S11 [Candidatus Kuenenbacteria bacterium GW2011_GWA2_42_15]OGG89665.1 MAG: 30S ribosomal protein S11 [Candidatus Kuenenbacteria bacterium RIFCSPHIGHO2_02_FULL_42_29]OGG91364.1 MAG: 30S ribosomal protein S11 [Candidatus Kuenenbacteria bacterium RIFCSPLOWO2_02_FULL_42_16]OGG92323.1 MAG: 30S ribosomal protein S11 [Candidatus Kuenenbacteria bacterium RIFCSPLOWO2_12_FULL_42_13]OGG98896.1 MAG: 30S ribosomal protein S11 [Candidatus Kuenenbacteria bacterium RIFCSPHIGHO2_12